MSFVKLDGQNFEVSSILLKPSTRFVSSSLTGISTGSAYVSPVRSKCIKQIIDLESAFWNLAKDATDGDSNISKYNIDNFKRALSHEKAKADASAGQTNLTSSLNQYLSLIDEAPKDVRFNKYIDIFRFDPPFSFTKNTTVKNITRKVLMPHHMHRYENCGFYYTNYNTLNFFDNDKIPTGSALIYPNATNLYDLPDSFSLNFWINPRYSSADRDYKTGTIFHLSSSIAVSLVSGSNINRFGEESDFKILLQLSHSADIPPSSVSLTSPSTTKPRDLIFTSSHTLKKNNWHHVSISWSGNSNNGYGSLFIDQNETKFYIPSSSVSSSRC